MERQQLIFQARPRAPAATGSSACRCARRDSAAAPDAGVERQRRDDLLVLLARRREVIFASTQRRPRVPAPPRSQPGLRLGALRQLRHLSRQRRRQRRRAPDHDARLRRRGHGLRQGRLDRLHVGARRRHRSLSHGRRRQERPAPHPRRRLRRRRVLQRRLHANRLARVAAEAGPGARRLPALLAQNLVRPTKLELYVANADGSDADAGHLPRRGVVRALLAPRRRAHPLLVELRRSAAGASSTSGPFDVDGTRLERITTAPGFDGFPHVLARRQAAGVLVEPRDARRPARHQRLPRRWIEDAPVAAPSPAPPIASLADIRWLADPAREGRGVGTAGLDAAGAYIEERFRALGLAPAGARRLSASRSPCVTSVKSSRRRARRRRRRSSRPTSFVPLGFSARGKASAPLVLAGYGLRDADVGIDDYAGLDVQRKIVVVRRFVARRRQVQRRPRRSAATAICARRRGSRASAARSALLVVDAPAKPANAPADWQAPDEARLPASTGGLRRRGHPGGRGQARRARAARRQARAPAKPSTATSRGRARERHASRRSTSSGACPRRARTSCRARSSSARTTITSASAVATRSRPTATCRTSAPTTTPRARRRCSRWRARSPRKHDLSRDVVFVAFSGEESGVLGST